MAVPVICPACGHPNCLTVRTVHDRASDVLAVETWRDHRCPACAAAFQSLSKTRVLVQSLQIRVSLAMGSTASGS